MNKQEKEDLIQALYDIGGCEAEDEWARGYDDGVNAAIEVVKEIKVQGKVVVPRPVAEMIEIYKEKEISLAYLMRYFKSWHNKVNKGTMDSEALSWIVNNLEEFLDAWIHGYEVEKEQLYYVKFDILYLQKYLVKNVETDQFYLSNNEKVVGNYE